jgi:cell division protein FtsB
MRLLSGCVFCVTPSSHNGEYHAALEFSANSSYKGSLTGLPPLFVRKAARRTGWIVALAVTAVYGWIAIHGPQGLQALLEKHREMRQLQEENAEKQRQNEILRDRIDRLADSPSEQEMEIRKQLKLLRPGETTFLLPDSPKGK